MTAAQVERLHEHLQPLRLFKSRERLEALLQDTTTKEFSYADFLDGVLTEEVASENRQARDDAHPPRAFPLREGPRRLRLQLPALARQEAEFGYLPIDRIGDNFFFQLVSRRYERGPMILTSNQGFASWTDVFGDRVIATAILDPFLHHAITLRIRGNSYRLKDKLKAGLVRPAEAMETT